MKKWSLFIALIILIFLVIIIFSNLSKVNSKLIEIVHVKKSEIIDYIKATGRVESVEEAVIYARENMIIEKILFEEGEKVKAGWQLVKIDLTEKKEAIKKAKIKLDQAQIAVDVAKSKLGTSEYAYSDPSELETNRTKKYSNYLKILIEKKAAERELKIAKELYKFGAESLLDLKLKEDRLKEAEIQLSQAKHELDEANQLFTKKEKTNIKLFEFKTEYESSLNHKAIAESELELAISQMARLKVTSSIDGTIVKINVKELTPISIRQEILVVADLRQLQIRAEVDELDAVRIKTKQEAIISFEALLKKEFHGHVNKISSQALRINERTIIEAIILLDEFTDLLKISNQVDVKIIVARKKEALSLPLNVVYQDDSDFVWLYQDGFAKKVNVETGLSNLKVIEILNGVNEGDSVIIARGKKLIDGENVKIK